jgi:S-adenosylmethionine:tRNA ribosyltransferase-isomerase
MMLTLPNAAYEQPSANAATFGLPKANEATTTPERRGIARDGVRLLVTDRTTGVSRDAVFRDLPAVLRRGDLLVVNNSATIPAALVARRSDSTTFALHLSTRIADDLWVAEPRTSVAASEHVALAEGGSATFLAPVDETQPRLWYATLTLPRPLAAFLADHGTPIRYAYLTESFPLADYQTMFARVAGSAEMPSAARPFTPHVVNALHDAGVELATITLHTGVSSPERHERPYREEYAVSPAAANAVNAARRRHNRVIAVGTTVVRALESAAAGGEAIASSGWTDLIVTPERGVAMVDGLLTGFHEPQASHLDMLRAFVGDTTLFAAYDHAIRAGYLWHEFGDVHLIA